MSTIPDLESVEALAAKMHAAYVEVAKAANSIIGYHCWADVRVDPGLRWQYDAFMAMARLAIVELRTANVIVVPHGPVEPLGDLKLFPCIGGQELGQGGEPGVSGGGLSSIHGSPGVGGSPVNARGVENRNFVGIPGGYEVPRD